MTWTYTDPSSSSKDAVRLRVGDTDSSDPLLSDEEISYFLTQAGGSIIGAAVQCARALAAKFARFVNTSVGSVSESAGDRARQFNDLAAELEEQLAILCIPSFGGQSISEKGTLSADTDAVQPAFERDQFDNPKAVQD